MWRCTVRDLNGEPIYERTFEGWSVATILREVNDVLGLDARDGVQIELRFVYD